MRSASAASAGRHRRPAAPPPCALPEPTDDDTISVLGRICDRRESPQVGVEGVDVTVEDESGDGRSARPPARPTAPSSRPARRPGVDNLGKTFTVKLDEDSLPEGTEPDVPRPAPIPINLDNDRR